MRRAQRGGKRRTGRRRTEQTRVRARSLAAQSAREETHSTQGRGGTAAQLGAKWSDSVNAIVLRDARRWRRDDAAALRDRTPFQLEHPDELAVVTEVEENGDDDDALTDDEAHPNEDELQKRFDKMTFVVDEEA